MSILLKNYFGLRRNWGGVGMGGGCADVDNVGAIGQEAVGMGQRVQRRQKFAAVAEAVGRDVEDAEDFHGCLGALATA